MTQMQTALPGLPVTQHRGASELPFVTFMEGLQIQLLQADVEAGLWVLRTRMSPGLTVPRHKHTGEVEQEGHARPKVIVR